MKGLFFWAEVSFVESRINLGLCVQTVFSFVFVLSHLPRIYCMNRHVDLISFFPVISDKDIGTVFKF
jgi:hypothetical protein